MAEGSDTNGQGTGPPGNGTPVFGGFGAADTREKDTLKDGQPPEADTATVKENAYQQLQNDYHDTKTQPGQKSEKPSVAATEGAARLGSAQSQPGKESIAMSPAGKSASPDVIQSPQSKENTAAPNGDRSTPVSAAKPQLDKTDNSSPLLPKTTLDNVPATQKKTYSETGSQLGSGKNGQDVSASQADRPGSNIQARTNTDKPSEKPPQQIGGEAREHKDSQAPPGRVQENSYQNQNQKNTNFETKAESKSGSIPPPIVVSPEIHQSPKIQNPASAAQKPETAQAKPQQDLIAKSQESKDSTNDTQKQNTNHGKPASEADQHKKLDEPPKSPAAGELGSNNSAGREGKLVPEPNTTTDANVRGGTGKEFDVAHENTTREASSNRIEPHSQIRTSEDISSGKLDTTIIEKNREHPLDNPVVPIGKRDGNEPVARQPEAARDPKVDNQSDKDKTADIANKTETRLPGNEVSSGSIGAGLDGRPGRINDKSDQKAEAIERGEVFKTLDGKPVKLDLTDKATCKQLLDLINQIETNKFKPLDQTGRERLSLLLEMQLGARQQLKEMLTAFVSKDVPVESRAGALMGDKLDPLIADQLQRQANKIIELEGSNNGFRQMIARVQEIVQQFARSFAGTKAAETPASNDAQDLVQELSELPSMPEYARELVVALKEAVPNNLDLLPQNIEVEEKEAVETSTGVTLTTQDEDGTYREVYAAKPGDSYKSIAITACGGEAILEQLLKEINKAGTVYQDDKLRSDVVPGQIVYLPTNPERDRYLEKLSKGGIS